MLFDSWDSVVLAYILPVIRAEWALEPLKASWLPFCGFGGQFVGAIVFGSLAERYGRLPIIKLLVLVMSVLAIACAFAASYEPAAGISRACRVWPSVARCRWPFPTSTRSRPPPRAGASSALSSS